MYRRVSRAAHRDGADAGLGMIMVIGLTGVLTILIGVIVTTSISSLNGSARHDRFNVALTSAESGIDQVLSRLQADYVYYGGTYLTPKPADPSDPFEPNPACEGDKITWGGPFESPEAERDWARSEITSLVAANPACLQRSKDGEFAVIAPDGVQAVYSLGWSPSRAATNAQTRLIKAEYLFLPYAPSNAILTGGNTEIDSSTTVNTPQPFDPCLAQIHANGTLTIGGGAAQLNGQVSTTAGSAGAGYKVPDCSDSTRNTGKVIQSPAQNIPVVNARQVYNSEVGNYPNSWYDLCPDGTARQGSTSGPCTGTVLADSSLTTTSGFRNWTFEGDSTSDPGAVVWQGGKNGVGDGIYYVKDGDITQANANPYSASVTLIAAAKNAVGCPKIGGNIAWGKNDFGAPALKGTFMLADSDISTNSNFHAGSASSAGFFIAGDQIDMETSSQGAYGAVLAADQCDDGGLGISVNRIKNPTIWYVPNATAPFTSIIDTTLWLEYAGK
jgi:hypothetical protein